jgi:hypothetical protein
MLLLQLGLLDCLVLSRSRESISEKRGRCKSVNSREQSKGWRYFATGGGGGCSCRDLDDNGDDDDDDVVRDDADEEEQKDADTSGTSAVDSEGESSTRSRKPFESNDTKLHDVQPSGTYPPRLLKLTTVSSLKSAAVLFLTTAIPAASMVSAATNDSSMCKSLHQNINISSSSDSSRACYHNFSIT